MDPILAPRHHAKLDHDESTHYKCDSAFTGSAEKSFRNLQMGYSVKAIWESAKPAGEFVAGIVAIVAVVYGLSWVADDILSHASIHIDHHWWAYRVWHAWWWIVVPVSMVGIGRTFRQRTLGNGLWAVGIIWLAFIGYAAGMVLVLDVFSHLSDRVGFLWGTVLSCVGGLALALGFVVVGRCFNHVRSRLSR